jgi:HEAT repeat protein
MNRTRRIAPAAVLVAVFAASCASPEAAESRPLVRLDRTAEEWAADLRAPEQARREAAVEALAALGPEALRVVRPELDDQDPHVRYAATEIVARYGAAGLPAAESVAARVADPDASVRAHAAYALRAIGPQSAAAGLPRLTAALSDQEWYVRWRAVEALRAYGAAAYPEGWEALRAIQHVDRDARVRADAAQAADFIALEYHRHGRTNAGGRRSDARSF